MRAVARALRVGDRRTLLVATRPRELAALLRVARGRRQVVEHGTATGWTAIALALADPDRRVATYDPVEVPHRQSYLALVPPSVRQRIELVARPAQEPLADHAGTELLFLDGTHQRDELVRDFGLWQPLLAPGAVVALHDYDDPSWPGVTEAVHDLGLQGEGHGHLFVARTPL
jgi:predicted O-methyltransferase YrrM